jgi:high-affinity nickel-transport protein
MDPLPQTWTALCLLAALLGMRHGLDADHLATIDALTRGNTRRDPALARAAGWLFSLGHGTVVLAVAVAATFVAGRWQTPEWLAVSGAVISIAFLFALAVWNVRAVLVAHPQQVVRAHGLKARMLGRLLGARHPIGIAAVGALFALSFDTVSQAALFAVSAAHFGGALYVLPVAGAFVAGMACVDGLNGWWINGLVVGINSRAVAASRVMTLAVAAVSAAVGMLALAKLVQPRVDAWTNGYELAISALVCTAVLGAFGVARMLARRGVSCAGD